MNQFVVIRVRISLHEFVMNWSHQLFMNFSLRGWGGGAGAAAPRFRVYPLFQGDGIIIPWSWNDCSVVME